MIPAIIARIILIIKLLIILDRKKYASIAPNGSDKPDIRVYRKALNLDLVLKYIGIAILIPSGILWKLIAKARDKPNPLLVELERKVAIPSGILCIIIASIETRPNLYSFLLLIDLLSLLGRNLSINIDVIIPRQVNIKRNKRAGKPLNIEVKRLKDSGIKSVSDTHIITPLAKDRDAKIIYFSFFNLKSRGMKPIKVESPARVDNINA